MVSVIIKKALARGNYFASLLVFLYVLYDRGTQFAKDESVSNTRIFPMEDIPDLTICIEGPYLPDRIRHISTQPLYFLDMIRNISTQPDHFSMPKNLSQIKELYEFDFSGSGIRVGEEASLDIMTIERHTRFLNGSSLFVEKLTNVKENLSRMMKCYTSSWQGMGAMERTTLYFEFLSSREEFQTYFYMHRPNAFYAVDSEMIGKKKMLSYQKRTVFYFDFLELNILNGRSSKGAQCYSGENYDQALEEKIMKQIGCQNPFWRRLEGIPNCTDLNSFEKAFSLAKLSGIVPKTAQGWLPCRVQQMQFNLITRSYTKTNSEDERGNSTHRKFNFIMNFEVRPKFYTVYDQTKSYSEINFFAELAGYGGLLLGICALQISEVVVYLLDKSER